MSLSKGGRLFAIAKVLLFAVTWPAYASTTAAPENEATNNNSVVSGGDRTETLVIGRVTDNPGKTYWKLYPTVRYVADELAALGIVDVNVVMVSSLDEMIELLRAGKVDWVTESAYGASRYIKEAGAEPILVERNNSGGEYRSIIFSRASSGIDSLENLGGKRVAFEDASSTSGYLIPKAALIQAGYVLRFVASESSELADNEVGYFFSGGESNSAALVYAGKVSAAGLSDRDWQKGKVIPPRQRENLRIIYTSDPYPSRFELVRKDLNPDLKAGIQQVLLSSPENPDAFEALDSYPGEGVFSLLQQSHHDALEKINQLRRLTGD